jgi:hypothetical protein
VIVTVSENKSLCIRSLLESDFSFSNSFLDLFGDTFGESLSFLGCHILHLKIKKSLQ